MTTRWRSSLRRSPGSGRGKPGAGCPRSLRGPAGDSCRFRFDLGQLRESSSGPGNSALFQKNSEWMCDSSPGIPNRTPPSTAPGGGRGWPAGWRTQDGTDYHRFPGGRAHSRSWIAQPCEGSGLQQPPSHDLPNQFLLIFMLRSLPPPPHPPRAPGLLLFRF